VPKKALPLKFYCLCVGIVLAAAGPTSAEPSQSRLPSETETMGSLLQDVLLKAAIDPTTLPIISPETANSQILGLYRAGILTQEKIRGPYHIAPWFMQAFRQAPDAKAFANAIADIKELGAAQLPLEQVPAAVLATVRAAFIQLARQRVPADTAHMIAEKLPAMPGQDLSEEARGAFAGALEMEAAIIRKLEAMQKMANST